jgi:hypothetical protein
MKIYQLCSPLFIALLAAGCASERSHQKAEGAPQHAGRVQVLQYDATPRNKSDQLDTYEETKSIQSPYKEIALLTCEGACHEEVEMTQAIFYRARMLGANGVIELTQGRATNAYGSHRCVFRYKAIIYETPYNSP